MTDIRRELRKISGGSLPSTRLTKNGTNGSWPSSGSFIEQSIRRGNLHKIRMHLPDPGPARGVITPTRRHFRADLIAVGRLNRVVALPKPVRRHLANQRTRDGASTVLCGG